MMKRVEIKGIVRKDTQELEKFQNEVLRPILKGQHELLIESFQYYLTQRKIDFSNLKKETKEKHINSILSKDIAYKNLQIGIVVGQFSVEEFHTYRLHSGEFNKRILQMLKKRLKDTLVGETL